MTLEDVARQRSTQVPASILFEYEELFHPAAIYLSDDRRRDQCESSIAIFDKYNMGEKALTFHVARQVVSVLATRIQILVIHVRDFVLVKLQHAL